MYYHLKSFEHESLLMNTLDELIFYKPNAHLSFSFPSIPLFSLEEYFLDQTEPHLALSCVWAINIKRIWNNSTDNFFLKLPEGGD